jgi:hypothetical protein
MLKAGAAEILMGNHEFNGLYYDRPDETGNIYARIKKELRPACGDAPLLQKFKCEASDSCRITEIIQQGL